MFEEINAHRQAVQENIKKAFEIGFTGNDIEKAKQWQVGDEATDKHGVTYYVHALNAAGKPLWRKKKDSGANANNSSSTGRGNNSVKSSSSEQAVDISKIPDKEFKRITNILEKQNPLEKDAPRHLEEEAMSDSELKNFLACAEHFKNDTKNINQLTRYRCSEWAKLAKSELDDRQQSKKAKSTYDTQSDDKVKLTEGGFKKGIVEKDEYTRKNAIDLHDYTGESIEYYTDNGEKKKAQPYISEFYNSAKQDAVGGYEAYFDRADSIGTFRTLKEAISALETWINNMRVKGHAKPEWIYNESRGRYQMNYRLN